MADISNEIAVIRTAEYGEEVRSSICDAIEKINSEGGGGNGKMDIRCGLGIANANGVICPIRTGLVEEG